MSEVFDLDAIGAEARGEPFRFRFGGEDYELPPSIDMLAVPAMVAAYAWVLARRRKRALRYASLRLVRAAITPGARIRRHVPPALFLAAAATALFAISRPVRRSRTSACCVGWFTTMKRTPL